MALIEKLTNIADAIRGKTGGTEELTLDAMAEAIADIQTGGGGGEVDHSAEDAILDGSIIEYFNDRVTDIRSSAFDGCAALVSVNFPEVVKLGGSAIDGCTSLKNVNLPK